MNWYYYDLLAIIVQLMNNIIRSNSVRCGLTPRHDTFNSISFHPYWWSIFYFHAINDRMLSHCIHFLTSIREIFSTHLKRVWSLIDTSVCSLYNRPRQRQSHDNQKRIAAAFAMQFLAVRCRCGVFIASKWGQWKAIKHTNVNCTTEIFSAHKQSMQASNRTIYLPYFIVILANQTIRIGRRRVWSVAMRIFKQQTNISLEQLNSVCALANNCAECTQFGMTIVRTHHREKYTLTTNWATGEQAKKNKQIFLAICNKIAHHSLSILYDPKMHLRVSFHFKCRIGELLYMFVYIRCRRFTSDVYQCRPAMIHFIYDIVLVLLFWCIGLAKRKTKRRMLSWWWLVLLCPFWRFILHFITHRQFVNLFAYLSCANKRVSFKSTTLAILDCCWFGPFSMPHLISSSVHFMCNLQSENEIEHFLTICYCYFIMNFCVIFCYHSAELILIIWVDKFLMRFLIVFLVS